LTFLYFSFPNPNAEISRALKGFASVLFDGEAGEPCQTLEI
jgi:hypothetical protein